MAFIKWNFNKFIEDYLPPILKKPVLKAWLKTLNNAIQTNYDELLIRREADLFLTKHTGQVKSLEHLLNNKINILGKPIIITDGGNIPLYYVYTDSETKPILIDTYDYQSNSYNYDPANMYIFTDSETVDLENELWIGNDAYYGIDRIDFFIYIDYIDYAYSKKLDLIKYYIELFRTAGTTYQIIQY